MSETETPAIELRAINFGYRRERVLCDVTVPIYAQDYLVVLGPNGGGKTTLLRVLLGLLEPWSGEIVCHLPHGRARFGYVPQYSTFEPGFPLRVEEVALMGRLGRCGLGRRYGSEDRARVRQALERVRLEPLGRKMVGELSGGQTQRLLLARALASEPEAMILDEPMASLDAESREVVRRVLVELAERMPVVVVTHDPAAVASDIRHIACLNRRLTYHGGAQLTPGVLEETYGCPVELIAHGVPHRVLAPHAEQPHGEQPHG